MITFVTLAAQRTLQGIGMKNPFTNIITILFTLLTIGFAHSASQSSSNSSQPNKSEPKPELKIVITKSTNNHWHLSYRLNKPAKRLSFIRNPDNSRITRWQPISKDFEIIYKNNKEYIVRKDAKAFDLTEFTLTPTYKPLAKDYGPFSPYSNGGLTFHSGRFFACINECDNDLNQWHLTLYIPKGEHLIANNNIYTDSYSWIGSNSGQNIYVGKQKPIKTDSVIAIIDPALPNVIKDSLGKDIPKLMNYFEKHLGNLQGDKPTLFASYAKVAGHSSQGGTLPGQIFMHWNINTLEERVKDKNYAYKTLWFFAHEIAHYFQGNGQSMLSNNRADSWIHEGNADYLAALALNEVYPHTKDYVNEKVASFEHYCVEGLNKMALKDAADNSNFALFYTCGFFINQTLDRALKTNGSDIYTLWKNTQNAVKQGAPRGSETFLSLAEQKTSKALIDNIKSFINSKLENPKQALNKL